MNISNMITLGQIDAQGASITVVGILIVFAVLAFLSIVFIYTSKLINYKPQKSEKSNNGKAPSISAEADSYENAAISMALYMYFNEMHDEESGVITIESKKKRYSPWSSKLYGLNNVGF